MVSYRSQLYIRFIFLGRAKDTYSEYTTMLVGRISLLDGHSMCYLGGHFPSDYYEVIL